MARASKGETCLAEALEADPLPGWDLTREYQFDPTRNWTMDFAWPSQKLAVEIEGARHRTFKGQIDDSAKFNEALRQGWRVLRYPASQVTTTKVAAIVALAKEILCCPPSSSSASVESE
jgi:very-short-patch-repair endonuclease